MNACGEDEALAPCFDLPDRCTTNCNLNIYSTSLWGLLSSFAIPQTATFS